MRVAWLTCRRYRGATIPPGGLPPADQGDFDIVAPIAAAQGIVFQIQPWDTPGLDAFDAVLVRSTWDYADHSADFLSTMEALRIPAFNPPAALRWNARKTYLDDLARLGAPTIPTHWAEAPTATAVARAFDAFEAAEVVVKPQVGAGSRDTIRLRRNGWSEADLIGAGARPVMIQPFLPAIETSGELSLFYFGGRLAHTVRKRPAAGRWYANVDGAQFARAEPASADIAAAEHVLSLAPQGLLYARVDLVEGPDGRPRLIELEIIEPYLFLAFAPEGAAAFVAALRTALDGMPVLAR